MANTTNFGWETPDDTDLVKDGALAMRTLGNAIDTSLVDLKGGTTGQVLSKNSNTDLDYTWITPNVGDITEVQAGTGISVASGTGPIPVVTNTVATAFDAKGDLIVGTGADTFSRLAVGATNGHTLQVDSSTATGLKWAAAAGGGANFTLLNAGGTALTGAQTITVTGISAVDKVFIIVTGASAGSNDYLHLRINTDTGSNYYSYGNAIYIPGTYQATVLQTVNQWFGNPADRILLGRTAGTNSATLDGGILIQGCNSSGVKVFGVNATGGAFAPNDAQLGVNSRGYWNSSASVTSISLRADNANFDAGTVFVYTSA